MVTFNTTTATRMWQPHGNADYAAIGVATTVDVAAALLIVNIVWNANWPPYTAAMPQLVVCGAVGVSITLFLQEYMWVFDQRWQEMP